eukprot:7598391-Alexandrium_andersonii.AAC.1
MSHQRDKDYHPMGSMFASDPGRKFTVDPQTLSSLAQKWPGYQGVGEAEPPESTEQGDQGPGPSEEGQGRPSSLFGVAP